jgi:hypothetical protein
MARFFPRLARYLASLLVGMVLIMVVLPLVARWFEPALFQQTGAGLTEAQHVFGYYAFIRTWLMWVAGAGAALVTLGFDHPRGLVWAILALPSVVPMIYAILYMVWV